MVKDMLPQFSGLVIPMELLERRATNRFPLDLPMTVRWMTLSGTAEAQTESRDLSSKSIYFYLPEQIRDGSSVEIVMTLPNEITLIGRVRVCCRGRVRRTEALGSNGVGVAVEIERYHFLRGSEGKRSPRRLSFATNIS
jgi:hypothetical protein